MVWERFRWTWQWNISLWAYAPTPPEGTLKSAISEGIRTHMIDLIGQGGITGYRLISTSTTGVSWKTETVTPALWQHTATGTTTTVFEVEASPIATEILIGIIATIILAIIGVIKVYLYVVAIQTVTSAVDKVGKALEKAGPAFSWGILIVLGLIALAWIGVRVPKKKEEVA